MKRRYFISLLVVSALVGLFLGQKMAFASPGAVEVDNSASVNTGTGAKTSATISNFAVGVNDDKLLIVSIGLRNESAVSGVVWNTTETFTKLAGYASGGASHEVWYLKNPTAGTHNIVASFSSDYGAVGVASFYNVNQDTTFGTVAHGEGTGQTTLSVNVPSDSGDFIFGSFSKRGIETLTAVDPAIRIIYDMNSDSTYKASIGTAYDPNGSATQTAIAMTSEGDSNYVKVGFVIKSVAAPSPTISSINPNTGVNDDSVSLVSISGSNFVATPTIKLTKSGESDITCTGITFTNSTTLTGGVCPITGAQTGLWNVLLTNPDSQYDTLVNGFEITAPGIGLPSQTESQASQSHNSTQDQEFIQSLGTGWNGEVNFVFFKGNKDGNNIGTLNIYLLEATSTENIYKTPFGCVLPPPGGDIVASSSLTASDFPDTKGNIETNFIAPYTLVSNKYYGLCINQEINGINSWWLYGADNDAYADGEFWINPYDYYPDYPEVGKAPGGTNIYDLYFSFETPPLPNTLAIIHPANESNVVDFSAFKVVYKIEYLNRGVWIQMCYGNNQNDVNNCQTATSTWPNRIINSYNNPYPEKLEDIIYIPKINLLSTSTTWYAKGWLYDIYGELWAVSPEIGFTIIDGNFNYNLPTQYPLPTATSTIAEAVITCDPDSGFFSYSFCYVIQYLFVPTPSNLNRFSTLADELENKPPIGYFTEIKNVLTGINASGTPVFDIGNYSAFTGNIFTPLRTGISWLLWLFFVVVIFNRIRHLEL